MAVNNDGAGAPGGKAGAPPPPAGGGEANGKGGAGGAAAAAAIYMGPAYVTRAAAVPSVMDGLFQNTDRNPTHMWPALAMKK